MKNNVRFSSLTTTALVVIGAVSMPATGFAAAAAPAKVSPNVVTGVVTGAKGPEAGVWVIAETNDLPTRFIKIVVTDDQGRYLLPALPKAKYKVWVRGYGLVDSPQVDAAPGMKLDLKAVTAPTAAAAAEYYPANYWLSLMNMPAASEFPGTGPKGNGIPPKFKTQQEYIAQLKSDCMLCHQQGHAGTRNLVDNSVEGWFERLKIERPVGDNIVGNHGKGISLSMQNRMTGLGPRGLAVFADWTQRATKVLPPAPPRPEGVERNLVLTIHDFAFGHALHDEITTDKRNPTVNGNGWVYAVAPTTGHLEYLDPVKHVAGEIKLPALPGKDQLNVYPHNPMLDGKGRVWITDTGQYTLPEPIPQEQRASFCSDPTNKFGAYYPIKGNTGDKQILVFDPATEQTKAVVNCFGIHHLGFEYDKDDTLVFSGDVNVVGWVKTKTWDETGDPVRSQGWCPMVLDTKTKARPDGNITPDRTQWNEPPRMRVSGEDAEAISAAEKPDPNKDTRITGFPYGMDINPKDNTAWLYKTNPHPTGIVRFDKGSNPPETCKSEYYEPPKRGNEYEAYAGKSVAVDSKGIAYVSFNSGRLGRFDRSKCKVMRGPTATGQHCPEGWSFLEAPGPKIGNSTASAEHFYLNWLDLYDTFGLGKDIPMAPGSNSDSMIAWMPDTGKALTFRVPYPRGFFGRGLDGRIDDPKGGWKGKGVWGAFAMTSAHHQEGGDEGKGPQFVQFQLRSNPLEE